jgi:hypothetical protein
MSPAGSLPRVVRAVDPGFAIRRPWIIRRLAPDCSKIEVDDLPGKTGRTEAAACDGLGDGERAWLHQRTPDCDRARLVVAPERVAPGGRERDG